MYEKEILWIRCADCGETWRMDQEPTPEGCVDSCWTLGIADDEDSPIDWGSTVDPEGNPCTHR